MFYSNINLLLRGFLSIVLPYSTSGGAKGFRTGFRISMGPEGPEGLVSTGGGGLASPVGLVSPMILEGLGGTLGDNEVDDFLLLGTKRLGWKDVVNLKYCDESSIPIVPQSSSRVSLM